MTRSDSPGTYPRPSSRGLVFRSLIRALAPTARDLDDLLARPADHAVTPTDASPAYLAVLAASTPTSASKSAAPIRLGENRKLCPQYLLFETNSRLAISGRTSIA